ncbi:MAG: hypothetical protein FWD52_06000 [Candidatus Bathyarchaeota archaeon]|nr:hypothetical protein [Candidatus Termiticorpusculum sp.]
MNAEQLKILREMRNNDIICSHHLTIDTLKHYLPRKDRGKINAIMKELVKLGYIEKHPTNHGMCYAIARGKVAEIEKLLSL